jgi:hypothetical protein
MNICANDHQSTDQAMEEIQLDDNAFSETKKHLLIKQTFSYPTPTMMPIMLFLVARTYTKGIWEVMTKPAR